MARGAYSFDDFLISYKGGNKVAMDAAIAIKRCQGQFVYDTLKKLHDVIEWYVTTGKTYKNRKYNLSASIGGCVYYNGKPYEFDRTYSSGLHLTNPIYSGVKSRKPWRYKGVDYRGQDVIWSYLNHHDSLQKGFSVVLAVGMPYGQFKNIKDMFNRFMALNPGIKLNFIPIRTAEGGFIYNE
jgi:hypothetical protein